MRAVGWWQSVPEVETPKRGPAPKRISRIDKYMKHSDYPPTLPPFDPDAGYLYETLMEAGPVSVGPSGPVLLAWVDLQAWEHATGIELQPWESRLIRSLSSAYLYEQRRGEDRTARPPWEVVESVAMDMRESIRAMAQL